MIIEDCANCGHIKLRHGTGRETGYGKCNGCNKNCQKFMYEINP